MVNLCHISILNNIAMDPIELSTPVLIIGAGPVGLIAALALAQRGVQSVIVEKELEATKWPKMDITNCRSMELLKKLGLADELRVRGGYTDRPHSVSGIGRKDPC